MDEGDIILTDDDLQVCHNCIGEPFLSRLIERDGEVAKCSYCGDEEEPCIPLEELADHIEGAFERHYYRTSDQPDIYESMLIRDKESSYDWDRHGEPVLDAISNAASVREEVAQDVLDLLEERYSDFDSAQIGEECDFDADSYYEYKNVSDHEFAAEFNTIERSLKSERRFFNHQATTFLDRLFGNIDNLTVREGRPAIVIAGPGAEISGFFRARVFHDSNDLEAALGRPDLHLGPPPSRVARAGRMNAQGISVFYGASDPGVALAEVRPPVGSRALVARFELVRPVRLLDVESLRSVYVKGSIFDTGYIEQLALAKFLGRLSDRITMPVMPNDEPTEYLITQMIGDYLAARPAPGIDGILFPSVQCPGEHRNVVLFHHASRVTKLQFPVGTEISASQFDSTEDGPEPNYLVWEDTPATIVDSDEKTSPIKDGIFDLAEMPGAADHYPYDDGDSRQESLLVNVTMVTVHHVNGVTFETDKFPVRRHRFEKRNPPF